MTLTGDLIRDARQGAGLTQAELAARAGTYQSAIARHESGEAIPTLPTLERLLFVCGKRLSLSVVPLEGHRPVSSARSQMGPQAQKLRLHRAKLIDVLRQAGARRPLVFGSVARGEDREDSDVDLLIELPPGRTLIDLVGLQMAAAEALGGPIDIATPDMLKPHILEEALREGVPL